MLSFIINWDETDAFFLSIALPSIFSVEENNRGDILEVINNVLAHDNVWIAADQLLDTTPNFEDIIPRVLDMLLQARIVFFEFLRKM